ncbi:hypothetical protein PIB30_106118, partial [Stylosanthes scabra]|nr:hypothetical protein [Stylosanthes scabra]
MRRSPRICVGSQQAHIPESRLHNLKGDLHFFKPHPSTHRRRRATHMRGRNPRQSHSSVTPNFARPTHMRGKLSSQ